MSTWFLHSELSACSHCSHDTIHKLKNKDLPMNNVIAHICDPICKTWHDGAYCIKPLQYFNLYKRISQESLL